MAGEVASKPQFFLKLPKWNKSKTLKYFLGQILKAASVSSRRKCLIQVDPSRWEAGAEDSGDGL